MAGWFRVFSLLLVCSFLSSAGGQPLETAAALSADAAASRSPAEATRLAFQALETGELGLPVYSRNTRADGRKGDLIFSPRRTSSWTPSPPLPSTREREEGVLSRTRRVLRGLGGGTLGLIAGLAFGALAGAALGILDMELRTKELRPKSQRNAARLALAVPALAAGAVVGQLTYWLAGAKFGWDKASGP